MTTWDEGGWNRHLRQARSALVKRDALGRGSEGAGGLTVTDRRRERKAWAAKAKAHLRRLAAIAREAPDRPRAEETVRELLDWLEASPK